MVWHDTDDRLRTVIIAAQNGDRPSIEILIHEFGEEVNAACRKFALAHVTHLSQSDLIQEAWIRIWSRLGSFRTVESNVTTLHAFTGWIHQVSKNVVVNILKTARAQKRNSGLVEWHNADTLIQVDQQSPGSVVNTAEEREAINSAVQQLPEDLKSIVDCCFVRSKSTKDAAQ